MIYTLAAGLPAGGQIVIGFMWLWLAYMIWVSGLGRSKSPPFVIGLFGAIHAWEMASRRITGWYRFTQSDAPNFAELLDGFLFPATITIGYFITMVALILAVRLLLQEIETQRREMTELIGTLAEG